MLKISLIILVLQIGFNAALNSRGHISKPLIPSKRFVNSGKTRRLLDSDSYLTQSSRGIPGSESEQSESENLSFEDYSFRSLRPLKSRPYERRNSYMRHKNKPDRDLSLESAPVGKIGSNGHSDSPHPSSSLSRHTELNFRRPYIRHRPPNLREGQTRKNYRKANDEVSLEVSSIESSNPKDSSRLGEEASYLQSLLSVIEKPNNRRDQNRKYYSEGDNVNQVSKFKTPIEKLDVDEGAKDSLPIFPNQRGNIRKVYDNNKYAFRSYAPTAAKDIPSAYSILLVSDDDKSDEIPNTRSKIKSPGSAGLRNNNLYNRRNGGELNPHDDNYLSPFRGLKPRKRNLANESSLAQRYNRRSYDNTGFGSSSNSVFPVGGNAERLTAFRLPSLEDLYLETPLSRSSRRKEHNNRNNNHINFLRLSLSPDDKITLDEAVASDLSKLVSRALDKLNLEPLSLRRYGPSNSNYNRKENKKLSVKDNNLSNISVLRLGSINIPNAESVLRRYREPANRSRNRNLKRNKNDINNPAKKSAPYHEFKRVKPENWKNEEEFQEEDFPDEFSLDTLFDFKNENYDDNLYLNDNLTSNVSAVRATNQDNSTFESPRSFDENQLQSNKDKNSSAPALCNHGSNQIRSWEETNKTKMTTGSLISDEEKNSKLSGLSKLKSPSLLRNHEEKDNTKDTTDTLHLEFPWNDQPSPDDDRSSKMSDLPKLKLRSQLRSQVEKDNTEHTTDLLHLEFPWNDQPSPDNDRSSKISDLPKLKFRSQLRSLVEKDNTEHTTDLLHLEFPWNDQPSPDNDRSSKIFDLPKINSRSQLRSQIEKDNAKHTTDLLHLEFPWNDQPSPDNDRSSKISDLSKIKSRSQLRSQIEKDNAKHTTDLLHLEFPWNDQLSPSDDKRSKLTDLPKLKPKSQLQSHVEKDTAKDTTNSLHHEFPWNNQLSPDDHKHINLYVLPKLKRRSQLRSHAQKYNTKHTTDSLRLEFPLNNQLGPGDHKHINLYVLPKLKRKSQLRSHVEKDTTKQTSDSLHLEFPWNDQLSPGDDKRSKLTDLPKLKSRSQLRSHVEKDNAKHTTDVLHLEFPWNGQFSPGDDKRRKLIDLPKLKHRSQLRSHVEDTTKDTTDVLHLEFPWNDELSPNKNKNYGIKSQPHLWSHTKGRRDKGTNHKDNELNHVFSSRKKIPISVPDPFYLHPYIRNRNIQKHPTYYSRSYNQFNEAVNFSRKHKTRPSESHRKISNRRFNEKQSLRMLTLARSLKGNADNFNDSDEDDSEVMPLSIDRRPQRLKTSAEQAPPLATKLTEDKN